MFLSVEDTSAGEAQHRGRCGGDKQESGEKRVREEGEKGRGGEKKRHTPGATHMHPKKKEIKIIKCALEACCRQ